jgi:hypothetical protein
MADELASHARVPAGFVRRLGGRFVWWDVAFPLMVLTRSVQSERARGLVSDACGIGFVRTTCYLSGNATSQLRASTSASAPGSVAAG